jgi:hypothetical protein
MNAQKDYLRIKKIAKLVTYWYDLDGYKELWENGRMKVLVVFKGTYPKIKLL